MIFFVSVQTYIIYAKKRNPQPKGRAGFKMLRKWAVNVKEAVEKHSLVLQILKTKFVQN